MYIDTHSHLDMPEFDDIEQVIERAKKAGIEAIVNVSYDFDSSSGCVCLADEIDFIYGAVGVHPHSAETLTVDVLNKLHKFAENKKVVAIGETGLDYYKCEVPKDIQKKAFRTQLSLAQELNLPVIIHCREAHEDIIPIINEENKGNLRSVFHCFAGDDKLLDYIIDRKFFVSFTGNITFKKAELLRNYVKRTPLENMMIETDCPYLAPEPFRGQRNEPTFVAYIAKAIAELKGISEDEVAAATTGNAKEFFKIG